MPINGAIDEYQTMIGYNNAFLVHFTLPSDIQTTIRIHFSGDIFIRMIAIKKTKEN